MAPVPLREHVRRRLRELRIARGLTQEQLCERAGISLDAVTRIERGQRVPTIDTLERLAGALGITVSALVDVGAATPRKTSAPVVRIGVLLESRSPRVQRSVEALVRLFVRAVDPPKRRSG